MTRWRCTVCDYIYDSEIGDPGSGIPPRTPFEELPDTWVCPVCGASKDMFEKVEQEENEAENVEDKYLFGWRC